MYLSSRGRDLFLGVEDCKDPKLLRNLKFYLLLFYYYFGPTRKKMREIEGTPEILRIISLEGLGVTQMLF